MKRDEAIAAAKAMGITGITKDNFYPLAAVFASIRKSDRDPNSVAKKSDDMRKRIVAFMKNAVVVSEGVILAQCGRSDRALCAIEIENLISEGVIYQDHPAGGSLKYRIIAIRN